MLVLAIAIAIALSVVLSRAWMEGQRFRSGLPDLSVASWFEMIRIDLTDGHERLIAEHAKRRIWLFRMVFIVLCMKYCVCEIGETHAPRSNAKLPGPVVAGVRRRDCF